jgi:hypothetical protein
MNSFKLCTVLLLLALAAVPAFAADLVSVSTHVTYPSANRGGANEGEVLITNNVNADVRVRLNVRVVYADGTVQRLTGISDPGVLPPGGGFVQSVYFIIPADAALGTATYVADVAASSGGLQEQETSSASFQVVTP